MIVTHNKIRESISVPLGKETVNFKCEAIKGSFVHNNTNLISVTMNYTTRNDIPQVLAKVGSFIGWR